MATCPVPSRVGLRLLGLALPALLLAGPAVALVPAFPVQGRLLANGGGPAADGNYVLTFRLYADVAAEQPLWKEFQVAVPVVAGQFAIVVGTADPQTPIPADLFAKHPNLALGVQVAADPELPRVLLRPVPYAMHAATADALAGGLTGDKIAAGSVPAAALGFPYAGSDSKGGPALDLKCTGCISAEHLAAGAVSAKAVTLQSPMPEKNVQDALGPLVTVLRTDGTRLGVGKNPGNACALDMGTDAGEACVNGTPALWTRFAGNQAEMDKMAANGQLVYRTDEHLAWMHVKGSWRQLQFKVLCGDGVVEAPEQCDDGAGNANAPDKCRVTCLQPVCGDSITDSAEQCDDGNLVATDACVSCSKAKCGDGNLQAGVEQCDDGNGFDTDACTSKCLPNVCGDGFVFAGIEQCDDGAANADVPDKCRKSCKNPACGDGIQDAAEECDDGQANANTADKCRTTCKKAFCGDGIKDGAEQCDDGNKTDNDACSNACKSGFSQGCAIQQAEHPAYTTPARDVVLCGNNYGTGNIQSACAAGWTVCTLSQWNQRYPKGVYPGGLLSSWGADQANRSVNGLWNAGAPANSQTWTCGSGGCKDGYNPWNNGKYLYDDSKSTILKGSGSCCSWDSSFSAGSSSNMAVYCCRN